MAISRLAVSNPSANTDTLLYYRTGSRVALASVIATNKSATAATIRVWVVPELQEAVPANHVTIAYNIPITGNNSLETFRFAIEPEDKVYIRVTSADISVYLTGIDNTTVSGTEYATVLEIANKALVYSLVGL